AHLRERVSLAGFAQRDPLIEYQDQGFRLFQRLLLNIQSAIVRAVMQVDFGQFQPQQVLREAEGELTETTTNAGEIDPGIQEEPNPSTPLRINRAGNLRTQQLNNSITGREHGDVGPPAVARRVKVGRNDPCPCGSGKKYKKCCGK
ncbi:SEC-C domain-containing protein, partial [Candidatus Peregrinibacteria bacterium]|nr:SEC-C domain-containing protein [Candidatus Peregrinibacteria bacterium]